ncbi:hypothetical protein D9756_011277, partial [Leucocoprinus leucothites]
MPSHTAASGLIKLYELDGAPWKWPAWQERTGVLHGLFPDDDKHLPPGWSRQDARDVKAYFQAYIELKREDRKIQFATRPKGGGANFPGRAIWNAFVSRHWNRWGLHSVIVEEIREFDIHPTSVIARDSSLRGQWPHADAYVSMILDTLGMKLFGEEAFPEDCEVLPAGLRKALQVFVQRSWNTIRGQVKALRDRRYEIEATAKAAFIDLETNKPTKANVARTIRAVAKWKETAELFSAPGDIKTANEMLGELQRIMEDIGANVKKVKGAESTGYDCISSFIVVMLTRRPGACKVSAKALKSLATEEDVTELLHVYHEYFEAHAEDEEEQPISDALEENRSLNDCAGDLGMEIEGKKSFVALCKALGFRTGIPVQFNNHRHRAGVSPWDDEKLFKIEPAFLSRLSLHWHQLAGVHSIARSIFTEEKAINHTLGVLVGDEVGLGKTAQAITFIAFLNQLIFLQQQNATFPPILANRPWLGGSQKIPSLPHLILCPGTLIPQWVHELQVLFLPKSVDILVYDSQVDSAAFWGPSGPLHKSVQPPHNRIIVASHSVVFNDFKKLHRQPKKGRGTRPWDIPDMKPSKSLKDTIFDQWFLTIIVDEAHHMRNAGNKHMSMLRLLQQAKVSLIMTATPLHTA